MNSSSSVRGGASADARLRVNFGVVFNEDCWRLLKRLYDLGSDLEIEVRVAGESVFRRVGDFDLTGMHSAPFSTEDEVLYELMIRAPDLRVRRRSGSVPDTIRNVIRCYGPLPLATPLPPPILPVRAEVGVVAPVSQRERRLGSGVANKGKKGTVPANDVA